MAATLPLSDTLGGYLAKLTMRSRRTILTEGTSDILFVNFLILRVAEKLGRNLPIVVDSAETLTNPAPVLPNREKVEYIHNNFTDRQKLAALVDREFRKFKFTPQFIDEIDGHHVHQDSCFWTKGHSVENYFFCEKMVFRFFEFWCPEHHLEIRALLSPKLPILFSEMAWLSVAFFDNSLLSRGNGIARRSHWNITGGNPQIDIDAICVDLSSRGVDGATVSSLKQAYELHRSRNSVSKEFHKWLSHGHIGSQFLWAGIARLLEPLITNTGRIEEIEMGQTQLKHRIMCEDLAKHFETHADISDLKLIEWLQA